MMYPWEDPTKMTLYHVQLETRDRIVSYEIGTPDFNPVELAKAHLGQLLPGEPIWEGGSSSIGYLELHLEPVFVEVEVLTGPPLPGGIK